MKKHALLPIFLALTLGFALPVAAEEPAPIAGDYLGRYDPASEYIGADVFPSYYAGAYTVGKDLPEGEYYYVVPEKTSGGTLHITLANGKTRTHGSDGGSFHALYLPDGASLAISGAGGLITRYNSHFFQSEAVVRFAIFRFIPGDQGPAASQLPTYAVTVLDGSRDACYKIIDPGYDIGDHDVMTVVPLAYGVVYTIPPTPDGYYLEIVNAAIWTLPEGEHG